MYKAKKSSRATTKKNVVKSLSRPPVINSFCGSSIDGYVEMSLPNLTQSPYTTSEYSDSDDIGCYNYNSNSSRNSIKKNSILFHGLELEKKKDIYSFTSDEDNNNNDENMMISTMNSKMQSQNTSGSFAKQSLMEMRRKKIIHKQQQRNKKSLVTPFQKLDAMSIVEIRIIVGGDLNFNSGDKSNNEKGGLFESKLLVTAGILHQREEEMKKISLIQQQQDSKSTNNWNASLIYQKCNEQIMDSQQHPNQLIYQKKKKQVIIQIPENNRSGNNSSSEGIPDFTQLIQTTLHRFFQDGIIHCSDESQGPDILHLLEYFQILYSPNQMHFESIGSYLRVRMWAHYFLKRSVLKDYVLEEILKGVKVRRGVGFIILGDGKKGSSEFIFKGRKLMVFDVDIVIDLFAPQYDDDEEENDDSCVGIDETLRQDFSFFLQEGLPGTSVSFKIEDVKRVNESGVGGMEKNAVLYVDFYPRPTKVVAATPPPQMIEPEEQQQPIVSKPTRNDLTKKQQHELLVPDALSNSSQQQEQESSCTDDDDDEDIIIPTNIIKMSEILGSISDYNDSSDCGDIKTENVKSSHVKNDTSISLADHSDSECELNFIHRKKLSCINENINHDGDNESNNTPQDVSTDGNIYNNNNQSNNDHSQNTPVKSNFSTTDNINNESEESTPTQDNITQVNNDVNTVKYSCFKEMNHDNDNDNNNVSSHQTKDSDLDSSEYESKQRKKHHQNPPRDNHSPTTATPSTYTANTNFPPPPTPVSPNNVTDVPSPTKDISTAKSKNFSQQQKAHKQVGDQDNDNNNEEQDNKSSITNLWIVEKEENFDILDWYQNLWDMKSITSFTSNNNNNKDTDETQQNYNNMDQQSFIGPIFSFASFDNDNASVLTGTIMSHQEAMEDNCLDSCEQISRKYIGNNMICKSTGIEVDDEEGYVNQSSCSRNWFCSNLLDPTMELTMKLCDFNHGGYIKDEKKIDNKEELCNTITINTVSSSDNNNNNHSVSTTMTRNTTTTNNGAGCDTNIIENTNTQ